MQAIVTLFICLFLLVEGCHVARIVQFSKLKAKGLVLRASESSDAPMWQVQDDSSEIECESSVELQRKRDAQKRKEEEERRRKEEEELRRRQLEEEERLRQEQEKEEKLRVKTAVVTTNISTPKESQAVAAPTLSSSLSKGEGKLFDISLLVFFPIIIVTLGLFFVFPLIAPEFSKTLPPPMSY